MLSHDTLHIKKKKRKKEISPRAKLRTGDSGEEKLRLNGRNLKQTQIHCRRPSAATAWEGVGGGGEMERDGRGGDGEERQGG